MTRGEAKYNGQALTTVGQKLCDGCKGVQWSDSVELAHSEILPVQSDLDGSATEQESTAIGRGPLGIKELPGFLQKSVQASEHELDREIAAFDALSAEAKVERTVTRNPPRARTCRWFHMSGCNPGALMAFAEAYHLDPAVVAACSNVVVKPSVSFHLARSVATKFSHLFIVGHYLQSGA